MANLGKEIGYAKVHVAVVSAMNLLSKISYNPNWENVFQKGFKDFKSNHDPGEYIAFKAAILSHTFWTCGNEVFPIPIPRDSLEKLVCSYDSSLKEFPVKTIDEMYS